MKEKMLEAIQNAVNEVKENQENGWDALLTVSIEKLNYYKAFYEEVTGHEVTVKNWVVTEI